MIHRAKRLAATDRLLCALKWCFIVNTRIAASVNKLYSEFFTSSDSDVQRDREETGHEEVFICGLIIKERSLSTTECSNI